MSDSYTVGKLRSQIAMLENTLHACEIPLPKKCDTHYLVSKENNKIESRFWQDNICAAERLMGNILESFWTEHELYPIADILYQHNILNPNEKYATLLCREWIT